MADSPSGMRDVVREIVWQEVLPGLCLFRAVILALHPSKLLMAGLGMLLMFAGWNLLAWPFSGTGDRAAQTIIQSDSALPENANREAAELVGFEFLGVGEQINPIFGTWAHLSYPWRTMFAANTTVQSVAIALLWGLWALIVWTIFGGTITRIAALQLTRQPSAGLLRSFRYTARRWPSYFGAPLFPLVGVLLTILILLPVGLLARADIGLTIVSVLWPLLLLAGLLLTVIGVGLFFGWPLMWGTLSTEGLDMFEALSRTYAYVYQRPWHFVGYVILAALLGAIGWVVVAKFMLLVLYFSAWGISWGSGAERFREILSALSGNNLGIAGGGILEFWGLLMRLLTYAYGYSYFWTSASAIYLLLRHSTDDTEMDDIFTDEAGPLAPLPKLTPDSAGVPKVSDEPRQHRVYGEPAPGSEEAKQPPSETPGDSAPAENPPDEPDGGSPPPTV